MVRRHLAAFALALGLLALRSGDLFATSVSFNFTPDHTFSFSGGPPSGSLTATLTDLGNNQVQLVITSHLGTNSGIQENLDPNKALYLNFNPNKSSELSSLNFALTANTSFSQASSVQTKENFFKADGTGGYFDILFTYSSSTKAFTKGESQTYLITTSSGTLSADDFNFLSSNGGPYGASIHVQNTGSNGQGSGWVYGNPMVSSPEPSSLTLLGLTGFGLVGFGWHRRKRTLVNPCG